MNDDVVRQVLSGAPPLSIPILETATPGVDLGLGSMLGSEPGAPPERESIPPSALDDVTKEDVLVPGLVESTGKISLPNEGVSVLEATHTIEQELPPPTIPHDVIGENPPPALDDAAEVGAPEPRSTSAFNLLDAMLSSVAKSEPKSDGQRPKKVFKFKALAA